jgi:K+/H+ antiporter YhaU regulatory subunit KhtT
LVVVHNIAATSSEKTVKDFFLFCGKIKEFELQKDDTDEHQVALVHFERESAAKTAILLTNALIDESHITVEPYFKDAIPTSVDEPAASNGQESKTVTSVIAEILASGYQLQDHIIAKGLEYDTKYGVTVIVQSYFARIQENVKAVDEKYRVYDTVTAKATELDAKYHLQEKAQTAAQQAQTTAQNALATPTGLRVQELATQTLAQIAAVHAEAKRIAAEKKAADISTTTETAAAAEVAAQ